MEKLAMLRKKALSELNENPVLLQMGDNADSGSDSEPEGG